MRTPRPAIPSLAQCCIPIRVLLRSSTRAALGDPLIRTLALRPRHSLRKMAQIILLTALLGIEGIRVIGEETVIALDDVVLEGLATEACRFELPVQVNVFASLKLASCCFGDHRRSE